MAQVDTEVLDHLKMVLGLVEGAGATVEEACPDLANLERTYFTLRGMDMAITARNMPEEVKRHFKQTLIDNMAFGRSMSVDDVADAHLNRTVIFNNMVEFFASHDVLACPVVGCMPHPQTEEWVRVVGGKELTGYMDWLRFAFLATTAGLPRFRCRSDRGHAAFHRHPADRQAPRRGGPAGGSAGLRDRHRRPENAD